MLDMWLRAGPFETRARHYASRASCWGPWRYGPVMGPDFPGPWAWHSPQRNPAYIISIWKWSVCESKYSLWTPLPRSKPSILAWTAAIDPLFTGSSAHGGGEPGMNPRGSRGTEPEGHAGLLVLEIRHVWLQLHRTPQDFSSQSEA